MHQDDFPGELNFEIVGSGLTIILKEVGEATETRKSCFGADAVTPACRMNPSIYPFYYVEYLEICEKQHFGVFETLGYNRDRP